MCTLPKKVRRRRAEEVRERAFGRCLVEMLAPGPECMVCLRTEACMAAASQQSADLARSHHVLLEAARVTAELVSFANCVLMHQRRVAWW